jgi:hypothetical protein
MMAGRRQSSIGLLPLLGLCLAPIIRQARARALRVELRTLHLHADYFQWQQQNGAAGLADAHKRIAIARADLAALQSKGGGP